MVPQTTKILVACRTKSAILSIKTVQATLISIWRLQAVRQLNKIPCIMNILSAILARISGRMIMYRTKIIYKVIVRPMNRQVMVGRIITFPSRQKRTMIVYVKEVRCPPQIKLLHDGAKQTLKRHNSNKNLRNLCHIYENK
ncbi:unnamed protein product [Callosobruchus maculatus]|uniref:Uncharacterized protein n=1 Tax=Callosobruchus maculatus TaxID=64391 RepID=A0A653BZB6_CALMS|nr:unnamed protein product [Callosobruchus maculatus]